MSEDSQDRTRIVTWANPRQTARFARGISGSEYFDKMRRGEIPEPPFSRLLGLDVFDCEPGRFVMTFQPQEYHYNPMGCVHGGILATVLDSVMSAAVHTSLPPGKGYLTAEINVKFLRPVFVLSGEVMAEGKLTILDSETASASGTIVDTKGNECASGTALCRIFDSGKPPSAT